MERRITEAKDEYYKLKDECDATLELLNTIIQTCATHVHSLHKLKSNEHRINLKYFLAVSQFQHATHQKILELNVELEEYLLDNQVPGYEHFKESRSSSRTCRDSESNIYMRNSPTINCELDSPKSSINLLKFSESIDINNKLHLNSLNDDFNEAFKKLGTVDQFSSDNNAILNPFATSSILNESASTNNTDIFFDLEDEGEYKTNIEGSPNVAVITQNITQEEALLDLDIVAPAPEEPQLVNEEPEPAASYISKTLKAMPLMTLEEKYLKSLPKPDMPDISLKRSDVKRFVIVEEISEKEVDEISENGTSKEDSVEELEEKKVTKKCTFKESPDIPSEITVQEHAVFEIDHRFTPLVGDICMIGFLDSPSNFYIQVSDENSVLIDVIATQLAEINNNTSLLCSTKLEAINQLGNFCTLAIEGIWYRAEVTDWLQNSNTDQVYVQLIDYGSQYSVSYSGLRPLPAFCRSHRLAQKCSLAYLHPPGSTKHNKLKDWPVACKEAFSNYCGDIDKSDYRITYIHPSLQDRNAYEIDLVRLSEDTDDKSIGEILLEAELAVQIIDDLEGLMKHNGMRNQILAAHGCEGVTSDMTREEILDIYFDEIEEEPSNINEAVMKYNPRDEAETCRNLRPDGTCYKGSSCKWRHEVLKSGFTNDKEAVYWKAFSNICLPDAGDNIYLTISHIVDIQCFYAQLKNDANGITHSINELIALMNEPQMIKKYKKFEQMPYPGELVIAKHWNNYWYRGQVRDLDSSDYKTAQAEVYFVDFGDILTVAVTDLREIMPEFLELPFQAVECRLYNLKHKEGKDQEEEKRCFESKVLGVTLKAHIVAVPGHLQVLLENRSGEDVGLQLLDEGVGELVTEHNYPEANELILID